MRHAEGAFVWTMFPFGPPHRPDRPGRVRHIACVLATERTASGPALLLAYSSSGPWRGAGTSRPAGIIEFDASAASALNQRPFHMDLRCLARVPATAAWFPDIAADHAGIVASASVALRERILRAMEALLRRSPRIVEIRGPAPHR